METYENIVLKRIGYVLFLIVVAMHVFNIGGSEAEAVNPAGGTRQIVTFGKFEQDNNPDNGPEAIEWLVLEEKDGKCLLLSSCGLDALPYHREDGEACWEKCSLRAWLNNDFLQNAFSAEEQAAIQVTHVVNGSGQGDSLSADAGPDTDDKVFLLSYQEAFGKYFSTDEARRCMPTAAATAHGVLADTVLGCNWWLRSPAGTDLRNAQLVGYDGMPFFSNIHYSDSAVRPALWVSAEAAGLK